VTFRLSALRLIVPLIWLNLKPFVPSTTPIVSGVPAASVNVNWPPTPAAEPASVPTVLASGRMTEPNKPVSLRLVTLRVAPGACPIEAPISARLCVPVREIGL